MSTREELAVLNDRFGRAFADQDLDRVAAFYANEARLLLPGMPLVRGRSAIAALFRDDLEAGPVSIQFESGDILEGGRLVVDVGRYVTPKGTGNYVVVYERQPDGTLKLAVDAASSDGPASGG